MNTMFKFGDHAFPTKAFAKVFVRNLLHDSSSQYGRYLRLPPDTQCILHDLVSFHSQEKQDILLARFKCFVIASQHNTNCFAVQTTDDVPEFICFSYLKCLYSTLRDQPYLVTTAARTLIMPQVQTFRNSHTSGGICTCEITGMTMPCYDAHVDHHFEKTPFRKLLKDFMASHALTFDAMATHEKKLVQGHDGREFVDSTLNNLWTSYHQDHAVLRLIHKSHNTSSAS